MADSMTKVTQISETTNTEYVHDVSVRRLPGGGIELWAEQSSLNKWPSHGKKARWHTASVIMSISPENADRIRAAICAA